MSDTQASETIVHEAESLLSSDMKSILNNCDDDESNANEKEHGTTNVESDTVDMSIKEDCNNDASLPTNGHDKEVNGTESKTIEPNTTITVTKSELETTNEMKQKSEEKDSNDSFPEPIESVDEQNIESNDESKSKMITLNNNTDENTSNNNNNEINEDEKSSESLSVDIDTKLSETSTPENVQEEKESIEMEIDSNTLSSDIVDDDDSITDLKSRDMNTKESCSMETQSNIGQENADNQDDIVDDDVGKDDSQNSLDDMDSSKNEPIKLKVKEEETHNEIKKEVDEEDVCSNQREKPISLVKEEEEHKEEENVVQNAEQIDHSKMDVDQEDESSESNIACDTKPKVVTPELKTNDKSTTNITDNVVDNDSVTLDLSMASANSSKENKSSNISLKGKPLKRERSENAGCIAEDLSLPTKRRIAENGEDHEQMNGSITNAGEDDDFDDEHDFDDLQLPPTPPSEEIDDYSRIRKLKIIRRLRQELLNQDSKLMLLKKIRQSQLKENISLQNSTQNHHGTSSPSSNTTPSPAAGVGINLSSNLRDLNNLNLLANHYQQTLAQSGVNSALNFSTSHNSKPNLVNNNVAHLNSQPNLYMKNNMANFNNVGSPMQAHMSKSSSNHMKGSSSQNASFPLLGRSPYNSNHLSAPPAAHGNNSGSSSKQRTSYDNSNHNLAHASHRSSNSSSITRSSVPTPPNYNDMRLSSNNSKYNQHISQSASPSPSTIHGQVAESSPRPDPLLAQRQAANVKQVLRKQLEKMPQPKVPPPEMHFIPNPNNAEFMCYLGLEKVVDYLTGNNQMFQPPEPFECVQCGTDFTPVWKWKDRNDPNKPSVICEKCVGKNMKTVVFEEHTKRINTFSKAYEELEKQMASAAAQPSTPPTAAISPSLPAVTPPIQSNRDHSSSSSSSRQEMVSSHGSNGSHNSMFNNANNSATAAALAAAAAASANFGSIGAGLSGFSHQQAHTNSAMSSLTAQQLAAMAASFMPQAAASQTANASAHQMSTPPAAHSNSNRSSSNNSSSSLLQNLAAAFGASNNNAQNLAALALLQQMPKISQQQSQLLLAQQLQTFSAMAGAGASANVAVNSNNAALAQLLGFPNMFYSSLLAASLANQKPSNQSSNSASNLNAATLRSMMDMLPGGSGNSRGGGHSSNSNSSLPHHNWKS